MRDATSAQARTTGRLFMKLPVSPWISSIGRYATILVMVANMMAVASLVGPSQAATVRGFPPSSSRLMASMATTGSSTNSPRAMISDAMETCWMSTPSTSIMPNVMASVTGIATGHQQCGTPLPEPDERQQNHQHHGF